MRGGHFVTGVSGEQFALPEAVGLLRRIRRKAPSGQPVPVSAAEGFGDDPVDGGGDASRAAEDPVVPVGRMVGVVEEHADIGLGVEVPAAGTVHKARVK